MLSDFHLNLLADRALDVELVTRMSFDSTTRKWPVSEENGRTSWHEGDAIVIPFFREGKIVRRKFKRTTRIDGAPAYLQDKGGVRCAFNEDCLRDQSLYGQPLIITEGELDAVAAIQAGYLRTISVPDGAPPPGERSKEDLEVGSKYEWLSELKPLLTPELVPEIIIAADGDDNGAALLQDLSLQLGKYRCKFVAYPKAKDASARGRERLKDLNEVLEDYAEAGVSQVIQRAQFVKLVGVYSMSELPPAAPAEIYDIGFEAFGEHYKLREGDFVVVTGTPSSGKTTWVQDMVNRVVDKYSLKAAWASFEQDPVGDHRRNLRRWVNELPENRQSVAAMEEADRWIDQHHVFIVPDEDEDTTLDWLIDKIEIAVLRHGCKIVVVDPFNELEHQRERHETMTEYVGRAIKTLKKCAKRLRFHMILIAHPAKMQKDKDGKYPIPTLYDIADSAHFFNKCDLGVIVHRETAENTRIKTAKSRYHDIIGRPGSVLMQFCKDDGRFREHERFPA